MLYVPYGSILIALLLIHVPRYIVGAEMKKLAGGYDNSDPRGQQAKLEGRGRRALAAHQNGFEAFAPFAIALLVAAGASSHFQLVCYLGIAFCVFRTIYIFAYLGDNASLRSGMWTMGVLMIAALFVLAIIGR